MNCRDWEETLALYIGGDLPAARVMEVERHLSECAGCQLFASGLREASELLQGAHADVPDPAHFAAVRSRVLAGIERRQRPFWKRAWLYGFAMAAAVLLAALAVHPARWLVPPPPQVAAIRPSAPPVPYIAPAPRRVVRPKARPKAQPGEPVMVKLETGNPDVVLYWISETKGDY